MSTDHDSDPLMVFPDFPTPIICDFETFSSDKLEIDLAKRSIVWDVEAGLAELGEQYSIMEVTETLLEKGPSKYDKVDVRLPWASNENSTKSKWSWAVYVALSSIAINALFVINFLATKSIDSPAKTFNQQLYCNYSPVFMSPHTRY